jgi:class 3 adenylate cyclase
LKHRLRDAHEASEGANHRASSPRSRHYRWNHAPTAIIGCPWRRIEFRIGIHLGDVVEESDGDLMGDGVNIAARLEGIAQPRSICLSEDAYRQVKARLDLEVSDLGQTQLKGRSLADDEAKLSFMEAQVAWFEHFMGPFDKGQLNGVRAVVALRRRG